MKTNNRSAGMRDPDGNIGSAGGAWARTSMDFERLGFSAIGEPLHKGS